MKRRFSVRLLRWVGVQDGTDYGFQLWDVDQRKLKEPPAKKGGVVID